MSFLLLGIRRPARDVRRHQCFFRNANDPADGGWIRAEDEAAEREQHPREVERREESAATGL